MLPPPPPPPPPPPQTQTHTQTHTRSHTYARLSTSSTILRFRPYRWDYYRHIKRNTARLKTSPPLPLLFSRCDQEPGIETSRPARQRAGGEGERKTDRPTLTCLLCWQLWRVAVRSTSCSRTPDSRSSTSLCTVQRCLMTAPQSLYLCCSSSSRS